MSESKEYSYSAVVPVFNEQAGLDEFHKSLVKVLASAGGTWEIIYCDDGSSDNSAEIIGQLAKKDKRVKLLKLSRNFGKESALSAGIAAASGEAVIMIDGDGQHPVEIIPDFIKAWRRGAQVVVGLRRGDGQLSAGKRLGSWLFYKLFNKLTKQKLIPGSTDFRLIDRAVRREFLKLDETDRITRGLIDWLGFQREFINFTANPRRTGAPGYSFPKLFKLAANSFVSLTLLPLFIFGYLGVFITLAAFGLGLAVIIEQLILGDPFNWNFTGTSMLGILTLFLVGVILMSQGILSLYISHIHTQSKRRPLYVIDHTNSVGIDETAK
jgi:dolichol-phosphate mannosyltransferase